MIVWGDSDRLVPPFYAHGFKKGIAGSELVSIPEAGHMVTLEKTAAVVDELVKRGYEVRVIMPVAERFGLIVSIVRPK